jgi:uncharacterized peroxidase-related enzyme
MTGGEAAIPRVPNGHAWRARTALQEEKGRMRMSRLSTIQSEAAAGKQRELLDAVQTKLGRVPNMIRTMAQSPAVLEGYLALSQALAGGMLDARVRQQLALATAQANECTYCLSAHTAIGKQVGLAPDEIAAAREASAADPRSNAVLKFARLVLDRRGDISDDDVAAIRRAGFTEGEVAEIIAHVALNTFTNYFNKAAGVEVDFPKVELGTPVACAEC